MILVSDNWGIERDQSRTKVDGSRQTAWAFTRLRLIGFPQYLRNVSEVTCSRFLLFLSKRILSHESNIIYEEDHYIISHDLYAIVGHR